MIAIEVKYTDAYTQLVRAKSSTRSKGRTAALDRRDEQVARQYLRNLRARACLSRKCLLQRPDEDVTHRRGDEEAIRSHLQRLGVKLRIGEGMLVRGSILVRLADRNLSKMRRENFLHKAQNTWGRARWTSNDAMRLQMLNMACEVLTRGDGLCP